MLVRLLFFSHAMECYRKFLQINYETESGKGSMFMLGILGYNVDPNGLLRRTL